MRFPWEWEHKYVKNGNGKSTRVNGNGNGYFFMCAKFSIWLWLWLVLRLGLWSGMIDISINICICGGLVLLCTSSTNKSAYKILINLSSRFCNFVFSHFAFYSRPILPVLTHLVCISGSSDVWRNFKHVILNDTPVDFVMCLSWDFETETVELLPFERFAFWLFNDKWHDTRFISKLRFWG